MDQESVIAFAESLADNQKAVFVASVAFELTTVGRDAYGHEPSEIGKPEWLRRLNEHQHRLAAHIVHLLTGDRGRYPEAVVIKMIMHGSGDADFDRNVGEAVRRATAFAQRAIQRSET